MYAGNSAANPNVEMIKGAGADAHQHVARTDRRIGDFAILEDLRPSVLIEYRSLH